MGANLFADGNTNGVPNVPTEQVSKSNIRKVEEELITAYAAGKPDWPELLERVFREEFKNETHHIEKMVMIGLIRVGRGFVPTCVMNKYRAQMAFHARSHHK